MTSTDSYCVFPDTKAIFFDFMGTCLDWHSSVVEAIPDRFNRVTRSKLVIAWREAFFADIRYRFENNLYPEDIDVAQARLLKEVSESEGITLSDQEQETAVAAWHHMKAWPDVVDGLQQLRSKYEVFVLANGTTRLQLDLVRTSGLQFSMLFSNQLLRSSKPNLEIYKKAMHLVGVLPWECVMVAAHAYDLRAAKKAGMKTVYIKRWTEDTKENMKEVEQDVDLFIGDVDRKQDGSLEELARLM